ncbi:MAG TPA: trehalose-phosphatase [Steroidobacteraceae bacterium]|nr:trehalose-phosphatase [Steroidobacteraceae bacterium]
MSWVAPLTGDGCALFLDVDGTLIELAPRPQEARVPPELPPLLARLSQRLEGAIALVSGRPIADLDRLFSPCRLAAAGIHGAERRDARGVTRRVGLTSAELDPVRGQLRRFVSAHPALLLEDKGASIAVHFRQAPHLETAVRATLERILGHLPQEAHLQPGHLVLEVKGRSATKRAAVEQFLAESPFAGRVPIYAGDDLTDREVLSFAQSAGGHGIFVGPRPLAGLDGWLASPAAVRAWLRRLVDE